MGQKRQIKLSYASRLSLAAMTLLLPLIVFTFILVDDRNAQIRAAQNEIAGLEYLVEFRQLLELVPRHRGLIQLAHRGDQGFDKEIEIIELAIDAEIGALMERAETSDDPFRVSQPLLNLNARWNFAKQNRHAETMSNILGADQSIVRELVALNRHLGNTSNLVIDSALESTHLIDLIVIELPQMVARVGEARRRALDIIESGAAPTLQNRLQLSVDDWALQNAHDNLFYGFNIAVEEDGEIARNLARQFENFNRDTNKFHAFIAAGNFSQDAGEIFALGTSSIDATVRWPCPADELQRRIVQLQATINGSDVRTQKAGWLGCKLRQRAGRKSQPKPRPLRHHDRAVLDHQRGGEQLLPPLHML
jgi:hypothetical protein